ncbi:MAG: flagellar basal body rod protein FlgC [Proteobacteria bacterium]|nr:flagellar basal body rod protein FlgC [Pseudomonadota bacterium]
MDLVKALRISASGMKAQGVRLRVISENLANRDSLATEAGGDPYRRKIVTFRNAFDRALGADLVDVRRVSVDRTELTRKFDPTHPAADPDGYVMVPNVNSFVELMDMREAQRTYNANLNVIEVSKRMLQRAIDILR